MSSVELSIDHDEPVYLSVVEVDDRPMIASKRWVATIQIIRADTEERAVACVTWVAQATRQTKASKYLELTLKEAKILPWKRRRQAVDYRKLNDALFGEFSEEERAQIDDAKDFKANERKLVLIAEEESSDDETTVARKRKVTTGMQIPEVRTAKIRTMTKTALPIANASDGLGSDDQEKEAKMKAMHGEDDSERSESEQQRAIDYIVEIINIKRCYMLWYNILTEYGIVYFRRL